MIKKFSKALNHLVANRRGVYRKFADTYDMVYFGTIGAQDEEHRMVRGVTLSTQHIDNHYCVGTIHGYDIVLLERTDTLKEPGAARPESYRWIIMQIDLQSSFHLPHAFLDGGHHDTVFYKHVFMKFSQLAKVDFRFLTLSDPSFDDRFTAYTAVNDISVLAQLLNQEITATLGAHFAHLDFEWRDDSLLVYCNGKAPTAALLEHMLRASLWLARELDAQTRAMASASIYTLSPQQNVPESSSDTLNTYQDWR